ncbi:hypothetical protein BGW39_008029 [Mortierella sp. 14UC]|nr:hypothetical protein BGW39_008029 [Mortierella sp. 14UC]
MSMDNKPKVLIVGAGLGGLMLGALLEKSSVPYTIFERATTVKSFGSAMSIGPALLPLFRQLGIYEDLVAIGKYLSYMTDFNETRQGLQPLRPMDMRPIEELTGYAYYIVARPKLYDLLLKLVPADKIHFGNRVLNITEEEDKVTVHLSNNGTFEGDIVVGADGAYSAVRQRMYEQLKAKGELPLSDQEELPFSTTCLVGQTKVLDPKEFPVVAIKAAMEQRFRDTNNSEWGDHPAQTMCDETRNFPILLGNGKTGTMGDLYDATPKEFISKVMLEEKVFDTWHHGRCVLIGDACHKLNPAGGHGAVTAMHDAITLANLLYAMPTNTSSDFTRIFEEYHKERHPPALYSYDYSRQLAKRTERGWLSMLYSFFILNMPMWLWRLALVRPVRFRPQAAFLVPIEDNAAAPAVILPSEQKARAVFKKQQQANAATSI